MKTPEFLYTLPIPFPLLRAWNAPAIKNGAKSANRAANFSQECGTEDIFSKLAGKSMARKASCPSANIHTILI